MTRILYFPPAYLREPPTLIDVTETVAASLTASGSAAYPVPALSDRLPMLVPSVPTPTPGAKPKAHLLWVIGQSGAVGRGPFDSVLDAQRSNVFQIPNVVGRSDYRTKKSNTLPLLQPEDRWQNNYLSPANVTANIMAANVAAGDEVWIVPCAWGATSLLATDATGAPDAPHWSVGRPLHERAIEHMNVAVAMATAAGFDVVIHIVDMQGEADNGTVSGANYTTAKIAALNEMRARVPGAANARIILGGFLPEKLAILASLREIQDARKAVAAQMTNVIFIPAPTGYELADGQKVHLNSAGNRVIGRNWANGLLNLNLPSTVTALDDITVTEGTGTTKDIVITFGRSTYVGAASAPITLTLGTLTADDFPGGVVPSGLVANYADGSDTALVTIAINADSAAEPNETLTATISAPAGYVLGARANLILTVSNDDSGVTPTHYTATFTSDQVIPFSSYTSESGHTAGSGNMSVGGGRLYSTSSGTTRQRIAWTAPSKGYGTVAVIDALSLTGGQAITWRDTDTNNYYWAGIAVVGGNPVWGVYKTVNGSTSAVGTVAQPTFAFAAGASYEIDVYHGEDDMLTVKVNGETILAPTLEATFTSGSIGHRQSGAMSATTGYHITSRRTYA